MPDSILNPPSTALHLPGLSVPPAPAARPAFNPDTDLRAFGDAIGTRQRIYDNVFNAASSLSPMEDDRYRLTLSNVNWADPDRFTRKQRKEAALTGETLGRRLRGTWELHDKINNQVLERRDQVVARVPYMTSLGTFVNRGTDYTLNHQQRLLGGVFTRFKDNGELEAHANVLPGQGVSHRYFLDPAKGVFKIRVGNSEMPLMPLLRAMGTTDKEFQDAWGKELYAANYQSDDAITLKKLKQRLLKPADQLDENESNWRAKLVQTFENMQVDPQVTKWTLGKEYSGLGKDTLMATTKKLLAVSRGEADVDDRDNLSYQSFLGPEDLFEERIRRDHGGLRKKVFRDIAKAGSLAKMPSGLFTQQLDQALLGSGLGQAIEQINPAEVLDKQTRITRMGEGGIPSLDAVPDEARAVQPSHLAFMDPVRTPESFAAGVDVHMARAARKGKDGRIYTSLRDTKTGETVWKSPQDLTNSTIATEDALKWDTDRVPVMEKGKIRYRKKNEIDFVVPHYEDTFSPLANLVPAKSGVKPGRLSMGSRYITQALPLKNPEAPLVQGALPDNADRSFEAEYGKHMGAVHADQGGRVVDVRDGIMKVRYDSGKTADIELYDNHPFSRKTYVHQTPTVVPGQPFKAGDTLAHSNFTDKEGTTALGINMRTAYVPWRGLNFKDAAVISESAAKRMTSEHMYQHDLEVTEKHKFGKSTWLSLFPQKFEREMLDNLDDKGIIKPGSTVEYGQPIILAAKERDRAQNKIHKKRQAGYNDESVLWQHHDPGVVTDVVWGKSGPVVLVKSQSSMQVGDKLSGRYGDKGVIAAIIPDHQMPHDTSGKPFEALLSPLGIVSRTNPTQLVAEAWLGKIARKTGKVYKIQDFKDIGDLTEFAQKELDKHGLSDTEDLIDPVKGQKIRPIATGERFLMKLHHTAESKTQGRGSGGYTMEGAPAKGGETGCFVGDTLVDCYGPNGLGTIDIGTIVHNKLDIEVLDVLPPNKSRKQPSYGRGSKVTNWFHYKVLPEDLVELELANGEVLQVTKQHEFFLKDGTRRLAGDLQPGDELLE